MVEDVVYGIRNLIVQDEEETRIADIDLGNVDLDTRHIIEFAIAEGEYVYAYAKYLTYLVETYKITDREFFKECRLSEPWMRADLKGHIRTWRKDLASWL